MKWIIEPLLTSFLILYSTFLAMILPFKALAQGKFTPGLPVGVCDELEKVNGNCPDAVTFQQYFSSLVNVGIIVAIAISVLITIYAGILYAQSEGEASKIALAKELIAGCLTGLAILLLTKLILPTLGISVQSTP
ncbi:MAG: hypothetical protein AAB774_00650 [Patescibacteria group bacterium]